ncbi:MAG: iron donor protein CyaY [Buchnera aphidicola (Nurudea yanoniella)]
MMKNFEFCNLSEKLFLLVEKNIERCCTNLDVDCEIHHNMIVITFENKSKIIINQKENIHQIWLATKKFGYHFKYKKNKWICIRTKQTFWKILEQSFLEQSNSVIHFKYF